MSDGNDNGSPDISVHPIRQTLIDNVIVHTVAIGQDTDDNLNAIAAETGKCICSIIIVYQLHIVSLLKSETAVLKCETWQFFM